MNKMNFSAHVLNVFDEMKTSYEEVKNLMFDLYKNELDDGRRKTNFVKYLSKFSVLPKILLAEKENVLTEIMVVSISM